MCTLNWAALPQETEPQVPRVAVLRVAEGIRRYCKVENLASSHLQFLQSSVLPWRRIDDPRLDVAHSRGRWQRCCCRLKRNKIINNLIF